MIVQLTLDGKKTKLKSREEIRPGQYLLLVRSDNKATTLTLTQEQTQRVIREILGAKE